MGIKTTSIAVASAFLMATAANAVDVVNTTPSTLSFAPTKLGTSARSMAAHGRGSNVVAGSDVGDIIAGGVLGAGLAVLLAKTTHLFDDKDYIREIAGSNNNPSCTGASCPQ